MTVLVVKWSLCELKARWCESFGPGFKWAGLNGQDGRFAILSYAVETKATLRHSGAWLRQDVFTHMCVSLCSPSPSRPFTGRECIPLTLAGHFDLAGTYWPANVSVSSLSKFSVPLQ